MTRDEALRLLRGGAAGVLEWNERRQRGEIIPSLKGANFNAADLISADLHGVDFAGSYFSGANLSRADCRFADFTGAIFHAQDFSPDDGEVDEAPVQQVFLDASQHPQRAEADWVGIERSTDLRHVSWMRKLTNEEYEEQLEKERDYLERLESNATIIGCNFESAILRGVRLIAFSLESMVFRGADLSGANLHGSRLCRADLRDAILKDVDLGRADLEECNLSGADLTDVDLTEANLSSAICVGTILRRANLTKADLSGADLRRADLTETHLKLARFIRVDLTDAVLENALVTDCQLRDINGRPVRPSILRDGSRILAGENAGDFFNPPVVVEVYLTAALSDRDKALYHLHKAEMTDEGVGSDIQFLIQDAAGGTVIRFQAGSYVEIYDLLPTLLEPFRDSRREEWQREFLKLRGVRRREMLAEIAREEAKTKLGRRCLAQVLAESFPKFSTCEIYKIRGGVEITVGVTLESMSVASLPAPQSSNTASADIAIHITGNHVYIGQLGKEMTLSENRAQGTFINSNVGDKNRAEACDVQVNMAGGDQTVGIDAEDLKILMEARRELDESTLDARTKGMIADDLGHLESELKKPEPEVGFLKTLFARIKAAAPTVATILSSLAQLRKLLSLE
jgi:uncharacterized protein YjbI with pentapeptide repeats